MIHLTREEKKDIREYTHMHFNNSVLKIGRLSKQYYNFLPDCLIVIDKKNKWFHIFHGPEHMSGPANKEMKI